MPAAAAPDPVPGSRASKTRSSWARDRYGDRFHPGGVPAEARTGRLCRPLLPQPGSRWPALSASEAQRLSSQGLNIVAVWESHSRYPGYFSYASGFRDATTANWQARAIGQPPGTAIYFAVDFDARNRSLDRVTEYFEGVAAGLVSAGRGIANYQIGVYGSGSVCDAIKRMGLARYAWLSNSIAWTGSLGYQDWNIRQSGRWPELSFNHDADEARDDYGGFRVVGYEVANANGGGASRDLVAVRMPQNGPPPTAAMIR